MEFAAAAIAAPMFGATGVFVSRPRMAKFFLATAIPSASFMIWMRSRRKRVESFEGSESLVRRRYAGDVTDGRDLDFRRAGTDCPSVPDERNGQAISQSGAARGTHRVWPGRDARGAGTWDAGASHGAGLQGSVPGTDVVRRGAAAGSVHQARRRGHGGGGCAGQG